MINKPESKMNRKKHTQNRIETLLCDNGKINIGKKNLFCSFFALNRIFFFSLFCVFIHFRFQYYWIYWIYRQKSKPIAFHLRATNTNSSCYCFTPCTFNPNCKHLYMLFAFYINGIFFLLSLSLAVFPISRLVSIEFAMFSILFSSKIISFSKSFISLFLFIQIEWRRRGKAPFNEQLQTHILFKYIYIVQRY